MRKLAAIAIALTVFAGLAAAAVPAASAGSPGAKQLIADSRHADQLLPAAWTSFWACANRRLHGSTLAGCLHRSAAAYDTAYAKANNDLLGYEKADKAHGSCFAALLTYGPAAAAAHGFIDSYVRQVSAGKKLSAADRTITPGLVKLQLSADKAALSKVASACRN